MNLLSKEGDLRIPGLLSERKNYKNELEMGFQGLSKGLKRPQNILLFLPLSLSLCFLFIPSLISSCSLGMAADHCTCENRKRKKNWEFYLSTSLYGNTRNGYDLGLYSCPWTNHHDREYRMLWLDTSGVHIYYHITVLLVEALWEPLAPQRDECCYWKLEWRSWTDKKQQMSSPQREINF